MEYRVLARKCRPQVFEDVLGQDHVVRTLQNAITQQRIAHAFLFSGPRGVGKTSVARILAKALNCESGPAPVPCNRCVHCVEITNGNAIDVREIDGASNRGIDEIRELRENVKFVPASCRYKIYIIDEVHMLTREAFNALLKTLEEPPAHVIFIFATTETQKVPATILSRCQCFDFRRIALKQITQNLKNIAVSDGIRVSDGALSWIAEAGDGSLRDAQSIFDQVISYAGDEIADSAVEEILGRSDRRFLFSLSEAVLARDAGRCLKIIDEAYYAGLDMRYFFQTLLGHFRNLLFTGIAGGKGDLVELPAEEADKLKEQADGQSTDTLQRYLEILMSEEENVRRSRRRRSRLPIGPVREREMAGPRTRAGRGTGNSSSVTIRPCPPKSIRGSVWPVKRVVSGSVLRRATSFSMTLWDGRRRLPSTAASFSGGRPPWNSRPSLPRTGERRRPSTETATAVLKRTTAFRRSDGRPFPTRLSERSSIFSPARRCGM